VMGPTWPGSSGGVAWVFPLVILIGITVLALLTWQRRRELKER
jgi:hypothetical protein